MAYDPTDPLYSKPLSSAYNAYDQAASAALPSPESRDRAAARIRSRLGNEYAGMNTQTMDKYASTGGANSGMARQEMARNRAGYLAALASGTAQSEDDYQKQLQTGAGIMSNIGAGYGGLADLNLQREKAATDAETQALTTKLGLGNFLAQYGNTMQLAGQSNPLFNDQFKSYLLSALKQFNIPGWS